MALYMADTVGLIRFARGSEPARSMLQALIDGTDTLGACAISVTEFFAGTTPANRSIAYEFFDSLVYWDIRFEDAVQAGVYRYDFARRGIQLSTQDTLIAAVARRVGAIVLTENVKDFPMEDVEVRSFARRQP